MAAETAAPAARATSVATRRLAVVQVLLGVYDDVSMPGDAPGDAVIRRTPPPEELRQVVEYTRTL